MNNISQNAKERKTPVTDKLGYIEYAKADSDFNRCYISGEARAKVLKQIMTGSNEQALSVLKTVDNIGYVPGVGEACIPINEFAEFYNVTIPYLKGVLQRCGYNLKDYPHDIKMTTLKRTMIRAKENLVEVPFEEGDDEYYVKFKLRSQYVPYWVSLRQRGQFAMYTPRIVLATALLMLYTDKSACWGNIKKTILAIKRGPYRFENDPMADLPVPGEDDEPNSEVFKEQFMENGVTISTNGDVTMRFELMMEMMKRTFREVVQEL